MDDLPEQRPRDRAATRFSAQPTMARLTLSAPTCSLLSPRARRVLANIAADNALDLNNFHVKFDYIFSPSHRVSVKYLFGDSLQNQPAAAGTPQSVGPLATNTNMWNSVAPSRAQLAGLNYTWTITPNSVLESRFGYQRFSQRIGVNNNIDPNALGINTGPLGANSADKENFGVPTVYYLGYFGGGGTIHSRRRSGISHRHPAQRLLRLARALHHHQGQSHHQDWWAISRRLHQVPPRPGAYRTGFLLLRVLLLRHGRQLQLLNLPAWTKAIQ